MTQPLALILYEKLLPGSQLVNRLQDLNYRVQTLTDPGLLVPCAEQARPLVVLTDLESTHSDVRSAISRLRQHPATQHVPVIAFGGEQSLKDSATTEAAGVTLVVSDVAVLNHLSECLQQALEID
jgi:CheY-like chemotaxis protein